MKTQQSKTPGHTRVTKIVIDDRVDDFPHCELPQNYFERVQLGSLDSSVRRVLSVENWRNPIDLRRGSRYPR